MLIKSKRGCTVTYRQPRSNGICKQLAHRLQRFTLLKAVKISNFYKNNSLNLNNKIHCLKESGYNCSYEIWCRRQLFMVLMFINQIKKYSNKNICSGKEKLVKHNAIHVLSRILENYVKLYNCHMIMQFT